MRKSALAQATSARSARISFFSLLLVTALALVAGRPVYASGMLPIMPGEYNTIYNFGDSLSDAGNVFTSTGGAIPTPPYFNGRFSNGPVWIEVGANRVGVPNGPALLGGANYAFGGARTGPMGDTPPSLLDQAGLFLLNNAGVAPADALYVVFGGGNDVRDGVIGGVATNIGNVITTLAGAGATDFLLVNLPDIGKTPEAISGGPGTVALATQASLLVNIGLADVAEQLRNDLGVHILEFDTFNFLNNVIANPGDFGYTNVDTPCFDGMSVCPNPEEYVFWDTIHPTATTHALFGSTVFVPVPAAVWLFASALGILGWLRRRVA